MKKISGASIYSIIALAIVAFWGCKKRNLPPQPLKNTFFFSNTEFTGIAFTINRNLPQPISIRFNQDSTFTTLCHLYTGPTKTYTLIEGKVTSVVASDDNSYSRVSVKYNIPELPDFNTDTYSIGSDNTLLTGGNVIAVSTLSAIPKKAYSLAGTWATTPRYYPDVNAITFSADSNTTYFRYGSTLTYGGNNQQQIKASYHLDGGRIYFFGIQDGTEELIPYYGILSEDQNTLYFGSADQKARLPYVNNDASGPWGVCPSLKRQ